MGTAPTTKKRRVRYPGIIADAKILGVHPRTLRKVLSGEKRLVSLLERYKKLKEEQAKAVAGAAIPEQASSEAARLTRVLEG